MVALNYRKDHVIINPYSRSGDKLLRVQAIVVHYTANPHANAEDHQEYFDGLDGGNYRYAGAHIFVDKDEAVEVIPLNEVGYHANERKAGPLLSALKATASYYPGGNANLLTLGIEMCIEKDGSFHPDTVERTRQVVKMLQAKFQQLSDTPNRVVRHYDITGKNCPKPFVENKQAWNAFLKSIDDPVKVEAKPQAPVTPNEGESELLKEAIVINSAADFAAAEGLSFYLDCPIYSHKALSGEVARHLILVGTQDKTGMKADKITVLAGADRYETSDAVKRFIATLK
jgi:N-acetylmuramoyl-L-alanine amidase CwlA